MTLRTVARRYANALFDVVQKNGQIDRAARDLNAFRDLVRGHPELREVFESPAVPLQKKRAVLESVLKQSGDVLPEVHRLLLLLADRDRLLLLADLAETFNQRVMEAQHIVSADVVTAVPLPDAKRAALAQALSKAAGSQVTLTTSVDPSIVGGVVARVGSVVFDGSVTRQIERMRQQLLEES